MCFGIVRLRSKDLGKMVDGFPEPFLALQDELTSTENKIGFARQFYNDSVMKYNNQTQMFPSNVVAGITGFKAGEYFEVTVAEEREAPKVSFS